MSRKDANKPKGRTTAYAYFVMSEKEQYAKVRTSNVNGEQNMFGICNSSFQDNPGKKINFGDFSKLCGQKWQQMDENDREDFEEKANEVMCPILPVLNLPFPVYKFFQDKKRYESEMANYIPPPGTGGKKAAKRKKDPNAPKRPQTAFFVFSAKVSHL